MDKLSARIANVLAKKQYIEDSMYRVYQYGIQMTLEISLSLFTSIIICCFWGKVIEGIIFFAIFIPLRSYLGGFHMRSYGACYICSCVTLIIILELSFLEIDFYISWIILCTAVAIILCEANRERLADTEGKRFFPIICFIVSVILIISIVFTVLDFRSLLFLTACTNALVAASKLLERRLLT